MRRRVGVAALGDVMQLWITMGLAAATWWPIYQSNAFLVLALAAIVLGTLIAVASAAFRWPAWLVFLVTVAVFTLVGVPLAVPGKALFGFLPTLDGLIDLFSGVALGWKQLLTITLPVGDYQALLVPVLVLLLTATVIAATLALRVRHGELAALPPVVVFVAGVAFGPTQAEAPVFLGLAMLITSVSWVSWWRWRRRREESRRLDREDIASERRFAVEARTLLGSVLILAIAVFGSVTAAAAVPPSGERKVLREAVAQPFDPRDYASPLSGFRRYLRDDRADATMLRVAGLPAGARIRIATLDSYDGVVFSVGSATVDSASGTFVRLPSRIDESAYGTERAGLDIEVAGYSGVWLPTVGRLEDVSFRGSDAQSLEDGFAFNTVSGTAADIKGLHAGDSYRLDAVLPPQTPLAALGGVVPGSSDVPRVTEAPEELATALDGYVAGIDGAGARLVAAIEGLRANGYISHGLAADEPASRSGHSLDRITELFSGTRMIGDAEQYAVAAALMADRLGFPARVVIGFAPQSEGDSALTLVRGSDISAWIEVDTAEYGWVTIDPVPPVRPIPEAQPDEPAPVSRPESIVPPVADRPDPREDQTDSDTSAEQPVSPDAALEVLLQVLRVGGISLAVIAIALAPFLLVIGAKARRRHLRRTANSTLARIRGGWDEFADLIVDHGLQVPPAATRSELAAAVGTLPSRVLAAVVDRAVFAPGDPAKADADRVWVAVDELRGSLDAGKTRRQRARSLVSVRSLGGVAVTQLLRRRGGARA